MRSRPRSATSRHAARRRAAGTCALLLVGLASAPAVGQTVGGAWRQVHGNGAHAGWVSDGVAPPYREAWRFDPGLTGRFGVSAPVIAGDVVWTVAPRAVHGVDLASGEATSTVPRAYGPSAAPAVASGPGGEVLIYTEGYGADPPEEAFPSATPTTSATSATSATPTTSASPSASPSATGTQDADAPTESRVAAFDLATQDPVWDAPVELQAVSRTGVTVDGDSAYVGDDDGIVTAIDTATGEVRWTFDAPGPISTSIAAAEGSVVFSTQPREDSTSAVIALDAADGAETWRFEGSGLFLASSPVIAGDIVILGFLDATGSNELRALALEDGAERWAKPVNA